MDAKVANALATSRPGWSDISGVGTGGRTIAELYADTYGGEVINVDSNELDGNPHRNLLTMRNVQ